MSDLQRALEALGRARRIAMAAAVGRVADDAADRGDLRLFDAWFALLCEIANAHNAEDDALSAIERATRAAETRILVNLEQTLNPGCWMGE